MLHALLFGTLAALCWGGTALTSAPASRLAGPWVAMLWMSLTSTVLTGGLALTTGPPGGSPSAWALVCVAGIGYAVSTAAWLSAVRGGEVSLVVPIIACDGALAAVLAAIAGEPLALPAAIALAAMVIALILVARTEGAPAAASEVRFATTVQRPIGITIALALTTAFAFAVVFYTSGKVDGIDPLWIVAGARIFPCLYAFGHCLRDGRIRPPQGTWPWLVTCGLTDAAAYVFYIVAAQTALGIAAVSSSQYGAVAAIGGVLILGERLVRRQWIAIALLIAAAGTIAATGSG